MKRSRGGNAAAPQPAPAAATSFGDRAMNVGQKAYDGAAEYGTFMAFVGMITGGLISFILIGIGGYLLATKAKYSATVSGTVAKANCNIVQNDKNTSYQCTLDVTYKVDGKDFKESIIANNKYVDGQSVSLAYDPSNPRDVIIKGLSRKAVGGILVGIGAFIIGSSVFHYYITRRFKMAAAASGVSNIANIVKS